MVNIFDGPTIVIFLFEECVRKKNQIKQLYCELLFAHKTPKYVFISFPAYNYIHTLHNSGGYFFYCSKCLGLILEGSSFVFVYISSLLPISRMYYFSCPLFTSSPFFSNSVHPRKVSLFQILNPDTNS